MCLNKFISELNEEVGVMNDDLSDSVHSKQLKEALSFSYLLASFGILDKEGNTSRHRIIRSDDCLIDFVLLVFNAAIASINGNMNVINPHTFDQLWSLYELLPTPITRASDGMSKQQLATNSINLKTKFMYFRLIETQLLFKWSGWNNLSDEL